MNHASTPNPGSRNPSNPNALLEQARTVIRLKHLSLRTEESYLSTIRRFIVFHGKRHPASLGPDAIRDSLTHLAVEEHVAASTQNVARNALLFLYHEVLEVPLPPLEGVAPPNARSGSPPSSHAPKSNNSSPTSKAPRTRSPPT